MADTQSPSRGVGRPPMPVNERRDYQVNVALSESEMTWLRSKAQKLNLGLAAAARAILTSRRTPSR